MVKFVFEGMQNFRELGGMETTDGRRVKKGMLFRSGELSRLRDEERERLIKLNISKLIDFRSEEERNSKPPADIDGAELIPIPIENGAFTKDKIMALMAGHNVTGFDRMFIDTYRSFVTEFIHEFSAFLKHLESGTPTLYHCTAGKDRTGFASMLALSALGVDREAIMEDYLASNKYLAETIEKTIAFATAQGMNGELLRPIMVVKREYLEAAWSLIDEGFGGMANYLKNTLKADAGKLQALYLESPGP